MVSWIFLGCFGSGFWGRDFYNGNGMSGMIMNIWAARFVITQMSFPIFQFTNYYCCYYYSWTSIYGETCCLRRQHRHSVKFCTLAVRSVYLDENLWIWILWMWIVNAKVEKYFFLFPSFAFHMYAQCARLLFVSHFICIINKLMILNYISCTNYFHPMNNIVMPYSVVCIRYFIAARTHTHTHILIFYVYDAFCDQFSIVVFAFGGKINGTFVHSHEMHTNYPRLALRDPDNVQLMNVCEYEIFSAREFSAANENYLFSYGCHYTKKKREEKPSDIRKWWIIFEPTTAIQQLDHNLYI